MGRKGGIAGLMGKAAGKAGDKADKRRKKMGPGSFLRGGSPGGDFLTQLRDRQAAAQESARSGLRERFKGRDTRGSILSTLFGQALDSRRR